MTTSTVPDGALLTIPKVAELMGSSRQHVYNLINTGELEFTNIACRKTGRTKKRVSEAAIAAYYASRTRRYPRRRLSAA